ncbi:hypothetical protein AX16_006740 [Volvariella volvacea WC 439]|nr:hypothetical protein AX16_006740 [Volvariella volvacea WC 439]
MQDHPPAPATAASPPLSTSSLPPVLPETPTPDSLHGDNRDPMSTTPIIRVPSRKSPPTCTITLANASTVHSSSTVNHLTLEISVVAFPAESTTVTQPQLSKSSPNDGTVPIPTGNKISKPDLPHALLQPSVMLYSQALSSGGPKNQPHGPRPRATPIQPPRKRKPSSMKSTSGPRPLQLASSATVLCSGSAGPGPQNPQSSSSSSASGNAPQPTKTALLAKPLVSVAPRPPKPKRPSSDLRFQALVQRSITRGLRSCTCHLEALAASSAALFAASHPTSHLNEKSPISSGSDSISSSPSVVSRTSTTPPAASRRCIAAFDSFNSQTFRLAQKLHTRLISKGFEPSELTLPPPLHKSVTLPPSGDTNRARAAATGPDTGVGIEIVTLDDHCDDNAVVAAADNESPTSSSSSPSSSPASPRSNSMLFSSSASPSPISSENSRSSQRQVSPSGSPPSSPTLSAPPSRYHHAVLDSSSLVANMILRHHNKDRFRSRGPTKHVDPARLRTTVPRTSSLLKVGKVVTPEMLRAAAEERERERERARAREVESARMGSVTVIAIPETPATPPTPTLAPTPEPSIPSVPPMPAALPPLVAVGAC